MNEATLRPLARMTTISAACAEVCIEPHFTRPEERTHEHERFRPKKCPHFGGITADGRHVICRREPGE